jgi:arylsulfatase A
MMTMFLLQQLFFLLTVVLASAFSRRAPLDRPNFLISFVDDLGYGDLGMTGHPTTNTPNIDYYSSMGRRLTSWYSGYPVCSASRTALLTGRQAPRVGMPGVINSLGVEGLPLSEKTIANHLSSTHKSFILGKWHQGQRPEYLPQARGFDAFYGLPYSVDDGIGYATNCTSSSINYDGSQFMEATEAMEAVRSNVGLGPEIPLPLIRQLPNTEGFGEILSQPTNLVPLTRNMLSFFKNMTTLWKDVPWLAYVAHPHVHTATPNIQQIGKYEQYAGCQFVDTTLRGGFGDALSEMDWMLGEMIEHVNSLGLTNNTLVLFFSDNGPWLEKNQGGGSVGIFSANSAPYRNVGKGSTWEGGIRMPAFIYWPGQVKPHSRTSAVISSLDVLPTLVSLANGGSKDHRQDEDNNTSDEDLILDGMDASSVFLSPSTYLPKWRFNTLLPFWNGPDFSKPGIDSTVLLSRFQT